MNWTSEEAILADLKETARQNRLNRLAQAAPKPLEQQWEERCEKKGIDAQAQTVGLSCDALAESLHDERVRKMVLSEKERDRRQYLLDLAYAATRRVQQEISLSAYRGMSVGRGDSDYHLHQSPEDQVWGKMR